MQMQNIGPNEALQRERSVNQIKAGKIRRLASAM